MGRSGPAGGTGAEMPLASLVARARSVTGGKRRRLLGIVGPPGVGKSTLAVDLCLALGPDAAQAPLDGFHLDNGVLEHLGLADRKGAPETFDVGGFRSLLGRLRNNDEDVVYAPEFRRELEIAIAAALPIPRRVPLVVVEGNYLLLQSDGWAGVDSLFDETWYLELDEGIRRQRLFDRHVQFGRSPSEAQAWIRESDDRNAALIEATRDRADLVISYASIW